MLVWINTHIKQNIKIIFLVIQVVTFLGWWVHVTLSRVFGDLQPGDEKGTAWITWFVIFLCPNYRFQRPSGSFSHFRTAWTNLGISTKVNRGFVGLSTLKAGNHHRGILNVFSHVKQKFPCEFRVCMCVCVCTCFMLFSWLNPVEFVSSSHLRHIFGVWQLPLFWQYHCRESCDETKNIYLALKRQPTKLTS